MTEPKFKWIGKIETKDEAAKTIKDCSTAFYALGAIQAVVGLLLSPWAIVDGVLYAGLAFLLRRFNSRAAAVTLGVLSSVAIIVTATNVFGGSGGGRNIVLALIAFWASIRAAQATFALRRFEQSGVG